MANAIRVLLSLMIGGFIVSFGLGVMIGILDFPVASENNAIMVAQERLVGTFGTIGSGLCLILMGFLCTIFIMRMPADPSSWSDGGDTSDGWGDGDSGGDGGGD